MKRFSLVGLTLLLMAGSCLCAQLGRQGSLRSVTAKQKNHGHRKVPPELVVPPGKRPTLDQLGMMPPRPCPPTIPLYCVLPDQLALWRQLTVLDHALTEAVRAGKLDELPPPQPKPEEKKDPQKPEEKKEAAQASSRARRRPC